MSIPQSRSPPNVEFPVVLPTDDKDVDLIRPQRQLPTAPEVIFLNSSPFWEGRCKELCNGARWRLFHLACFVSLQSAPNRIAQGKQCRPALRSR
jgi:hypothetical protein